MNTLTASAPSSAAYSAPAPGRIIVESDTPRRRLPWGRITASAAGLVIVAAGIGSYIHYAAGFESTDDSFLEGNVHPVSARINGTVSRVLVDDNAKVEAGQPLVELDPADFNLAVQGAEADLAQARANADQVAAQINRARADVDTASARIAQNAAQLNRAQLDFHRMEMLADDKMRAISRQEFDSARAAFDSAQANQQSLVAQRTSAEASLAATEAQRSVAFAQIQKAESVLGTAKLQAGYTIIRAPNAGRVAKKSVEVGQRLQPGQPVLSVVNDQVWVVANFKESQLARLRPGDLVEIKVDAVENQIFRGMVESFSPGTGAKFSLLAPDNATGNFTKIVQRVPVKILFATDSLGSAAGRLSPGLSANVKVTVRR